MATHQVQQSTKVSENVQELARWAVEEYNKEHTDNELEFKKVTDSLKRGVSNIILRAADEEGTIHICLAKVKHLQRHNELKGFTILTDDDA